MMSVLPSAGSLWSGTALAQETLLNFGRNLTKPSFRSFRSLLVILAHRLKFPYSGLGGVEIGRKPLRRCERCFDVFPGLSGHLVD